MAISPDEKIVYMQLSFHHGFVVFDVENEKVLKVVDLPKQGEGATLPREGYLLDSAHHGLAINPDGSKPCAAGMMSDYAAIVSTKDFSFSKIDSIKQGGRLRLAGTANPRARGRVRVRLAYAGTNTRTRFLRYGARIRGGRWALRALLPTKAARGGGDLSIQYSGDARRAVAGAHLVRRLQP